jgi:hypothetical protein
MVAPTHYAIRSGSAGPGGAHLKSWIVEISQDGAARREVDQKTNSDELNGSGLKPTFPVVDGGRCGFIRPVNR